MNIKKDIRNIYKITRIYRRLITKNYQNGDHDKNTQLFLDYQKFFRKNLAKGGHYLRAAKACKTGYTFSLLAGRVVTVKEWYEIAEANEKRKEVLKLWRTNHDAKTILFINAQRR